MRDPSRRRRLPAIDWCSVRVALFSVPCLRRIWRRRAQNTVPLPNISSSTLKEWVGKFAPIGVLVDWLISSLLFRPTLDWSIDWLKRVGFLRWIFCALESISGEIRWSACTSREKNSCVWLFFLQFGQLRIHIGDAHRTEERAVPACRRDIPGHHAGPRGLLRFHGAEYGRIKLSDDTLFRGDACVLVAGGEGEKFCPSAIPLRLSLLRISGHGKRQGMLIRNSILIRHGKGECVFWEIIILLAR